VLLGLAAFAVSLTILWRNPSFGREDAIGGIIIFGIADAVAYAIVVLSVSGIFFGIVWARTRNLFAVMFIHAATDLLPNFKQFVSTWGI